MSGRYASYWNAFLFTKSFNMSRGMGPCPVGRVGPCGTDTTENITFPQLHLMGGNNNFSFTFHELNALPWKFL